MNLAKVRSAIGVTIALVVLLFVASPASAQVTLAWLPSGTGMEQIARSGMSPGLMSAGLGSVPAEQTYLDITQGNRVFDSLYEDELPRGPVPLNRPVTDAALLQRAESAPADIVPGLLAQTLREAGEGFAVRNAAVPQLAGLVDGLRGNDLLIAIEKPPPATNEALAIGIAGRGFDGNLTSDSTRLDGYVLSTDVAPTILERLGAEIPSQMSGQPIRTEGEVDPGAVVALGERMAVISERRGPVIGLSLLVWVALLGAALALSSRGSFGTHTVQKEPRDGRDLIHPGVRVFGLGVIYLPLLLLLGAAFEPGQAAEQALVMIGAPALAALTLALLRGYRALAVASALTVLAYAVDVIVGSPLTALSLLGPNPGLGVRFYGIGNELEALLAVLVVAGTGAGLTGFGPRLSPRAGAIAFLAIGLCAALVFAAGRFGADVGAAIVFPVGAAVAAALIAARRRRSALLIVVLPFAVVALLALVDLVSGANAHLTRSVLDAGGLGDLGDVAQRRLQLSAHSFARPIVFVFLPLIVVLVALAVVRRKQLAAWLEGRPAMRAGLLGAAVATAVGTLANDSGALLLEIGAAYLLVFTGFIWAEVDRSAPPQTKSYTSVRHT